MPGGMPAILLLLPIVLSVAQCDSLATVFSLQEVEMLEMQMNVTQRPCEDGEELWRRWIACEPMQQLGSRGTRNGWDPLSL